MSLPPSTGADSGGSLLGPGRLVLVVGPSGAGKDTLLGLAREMCREDAGVVFARRVVTRPSSGFEDHDTMSDPEFERAAAEDAFAFWWRAHGLKYGIASAINQDIRAGRTVVCNVSRTIVEAIRGRYIHVAVVLVTAPPHILAERLSSRGRASDGILADRIERSVASDQYLRPDTILENVASPRVGAERLLEVIRGRAQLMSV